MNLLFKYDRTCKKFDRKTRGRLKDLAGRLVTQKLFILDVNSKPGVSIWVRSLQTPRHMQMIVSSPKPYNKANIFPVLVEYELNSLRGAKRHVSIFLRYLLNTFQVISKSPKLSIWKFYTKKII